MMSSKYRRELVEELLRKYYARKEGSKRRPFVKPDRFYGRYYGNDCDLKEKELLEDDFKALESDGIVEIRWGAGKYEIIKVLLNPAAAAELQKIAETEFGIQTRLSAEAGLLSLEQRYGGICSETDRILSEISCKAGRAPQITDLTEWERILQAVVFLKKDRESLYLREASSLIYGQTKTLERYEARVLSILGADSIEEFKVLHPDAPFHIRGDVELDFGEKVVDVRCFSKGISFEKEDLEHLRRIKVKTSRLMTIENKTAFYRYIPRDTVTVFLSGFATHGQLEVLRRIMADNPYVQMQHFGDIDAGGLRIIDNLEAALGCTVMPYHMGIEELCDDRFSMCLQPLTDNDVSNLSLLRENHPELVSYMLEHNVKLEQEIVALELSRAEEGIEL